MSDVGKDCQTIILKTERVVSLKIISNDASFIYDDFIVPFLKTSITFLSLFLFFLIQEYLQYPV